MEYQDYYDKYFHKVSAVTGICVYNTAMHGEKYPITIGKVYNIRYMAMFRSCSRIVVEGDRREYQSHCFKLYENGQPLEITRERFLSPYLRDWHIEDEIRYEQIPICLKQVSVEYDIHILWSALRGSRKWGYSFPKSDWDVWILYCHEPGWYQNELNRTDAIERVYNKNIDLVGWDIIKGFEEIKKGNPIILNWLTSHSDWTRDDQFMELLKPVLSQCFDPATAINYYYKTHIALNDIDYLHTDYPLKQFFFYLRGILYCQWIEKKQEMPPYIYKVYEEIVDEKAIMEEIQHIWYILTLRVPRENYTVSSKLIEYAIKWADYYKQIALNVGEFRVPDKISDLLDGIADHTIENFNSE